MSAPIFFVPSQRVLRAIFLLVLALAFLSGCSGGANRPEPLDGRYDVISVDTENLPATLLEEPLGQSKGVFT